jgi:hypothetical protein
MATSFKSMASKRMGPSTVWEDPLSDYFGTHRFVQGPEEAGPATLTTWPNPFEEAGQRPLMPVRDTPKIGFPWQTSRAWWFWFLPPPKAHVHAVRYCNQEGCRNAVHQRSEWCVDGSCRPCSRKLRPQFYCYGCRTKFSGTPTGLWLHGRQMCCICFYGSPPGGRL